MHNLLVFLDVLLFSRKYQIVHRSKVLPVWRRQSMPQKRLACKSCLLRKDCHYFWRTMGLDQNGSCPWAWVCTAKQQAAVPAARGPSSCATALKEPQHVSKANRSQQQDVTNLCGLGTKRCRPPKPDQARRPRTVDPACFR